MPLVPIGVENMNRRRFSYDCCKRDGRIVGKHIECELKETRDGLLAAEAFQK
jgi:hypothetical protein